MNLGALVIEDHDSYRFKNGLGYKLSRAARVAQKAVDEQLEQFGLTRLSWSILASVEFDSCASPSELANHIGLERAAVSRFLRILEADGLLQRIRNESDQRGTVVNLTQKGHNLARRIPLVTSAALEPVFGKLSQKQLSDLHEVLEIIGQSDGPVWNN